MAALSIPPEAGAPEWVHLLPAGEIATNDSRGPYHEIDADKVIAASLKLADRLPIDENHSTDLAASRGEPAPARGWITELQARADGVWGRVEWTEAGRRLVEGREYRGISPVILHTKSKPPKVIALLRASLVNNPNFRGLATLHQQQEPHMPFSERLADMLGLNSDAGEDDIVTAVQSALDEAEDDALTALQAQVGEIAVALGLDKGATPEAVLNAATAVDASDKDTIIALQSTVDELSGQVKSLSETGAKSRAETYVDREIAAGRVGVKAQRDRYIAMHMKDPAETEALIGGLPKVAGGALIEDRPPAAKDGMVALNSEQSAAAKLMGVDPEAMAKTLADEQKQKEGI